MQILLVLSVVRAGRQDRWRYSSVAALPQAFLQQQGINSVRIVARNCPRNAVAVSFVKGESCNVVHGGFQASDTTSQNPEFGLGILEKCRSNSLPSSALPHIDGDDMANPAAARLPNQKAQNWAWHGTSRAGFFGNDRERMRPPNETFQLKLGVRNAGRKTGLINFPQDAEIFRPVSTKGDCHGGILWLSASLRRSPAKT